jgi:signal transduction histidine kinase/ligand-binding sensor domain-containing protein
VLDFGFNAGLGARVVKWIRADGDGALSIVAGDRQDAPGHRGLLRFRGGKFVRIDLANYGIEDDVICALQDREGNLWAGTRTDGLVRLQPMRITAYTLKDGLSHPTALSVCESEDGGIYVGTRKGLNVIKAGRITPLHPNAPTFGSTNDYVVSSVIPARGGGIWEGRNDYDPFFARVTERGWLCRFEVMEPAVPIRTLYSDPSGCLWVGHESGVSRLAAPDLGGAITRPAGGPTNEVRAILQDRAGFMWFGTLNGGIMRWRDGHTATFTTRDGLSSNRAWTLLEDSDGVLWIGTDRGLNRLVGDQIISFATLHGLFDDRIHCILEDSSGSFWISGPRGIHRVKRQELQDVADGKAARVHSVTYSEADGMPSSETSGGFQPAGWKARDGRLWFPTVKGVVVIDPEQLPDNQVLPPVVIEQVVADGKPVFGDGTTREHSGQDGRIQLQPGRAHTLEIRYTANSFLAPERVRFRYQLDGHDSAWREGEPNERRVIYTNLRPGDYRFWVKACNNHGYWNDTGATIELSLAPRFTQTVWFPVSCALGFIVLSGGLAGWRLRWQRRIWQAEQQRALANERTRIARDLHDDLGTALTGVALEMELTRRHAEADIALRLSETAAGVRALVQRTREVVWAVNPACDDVASLSTFLEEQARTVLEAGGLAVRLRFPEKIPEASLDFETRHQLSLGLREAFTNILRHAGASEVRLQLAFQEDTLVLEVWDNGRGFDVEAVRDQRGHGLEHLRARLNRLGGCFKIQSSPGGGTTAIFRVPFRPVDKEEGKR